MEGLKTIGGMFAEEYKLGLGYGERGMELPVVLSVEEYKRREGDRDECVWDHKAAPGVLVTRRFLRTVKTRIGPHVDTYDALQTWVNCGYTDKQALERLQATVGVTYDPDSENPCGWDEGSIRHFEQLLVHFGKDFGSISAHMPRRTCGKVVEFYYQWKHSEYGDEFRRLHPDALTQSCGPLMQARMLFDNPPKKSQYYNVEDIVGVRVGPDGNQEYKVRWEGFGAEDDTWEPEHRIHNTISFLMFERRRYSLELSLQGQESAGAEVPYNDALPSASNTERRRKHAQPRRWEPQPADHCSSEEDHVDSCLQERTGKSPRRASRMRTGASTQQETDSCSTTDSGFGSMDAAVPPPVQRKPTPCVHLDKDGVQKRCRDGSNCRLRKATGQSNAKAPAAKTSSGASKTTASKGKQKAAAAGENKVAKGRVDQAADDDSDVETEEEVFHVGKIMRHKQNGNKVLFLTRWEGYEDPKYDTWEPLENFARDNYVIYEYVAAQPSLTNIKNYFTLAYKVKKS